MTKAGVEETIREAKRVGLKLDVASEIGDACDGALVVLKKRGFVIPKKLNFALFDNSDAIKKKIIAAKKARKEKCKK